VTLIMVTHDQALGDRAHRRIYMEDGAIRRDSGRGSGLSPPAEPSPRLQEAGG
jgi:ABC-type lipoprotein export system ATPase subunit